DDEGLRLHVLDSTHPDAVAALEARLPLDRTLFLLSSKSGGTLEPRSMHAYFHALAPAGRQWAAITDPGTSLEALAREQGFRRVFHGATDVGGRYSALTPFGVVPAAAIGADVRGLLERAEVAARAADPSLAPGHAPALWLGVALGELANGGRDKLTFVVDETLDALADAGHPVIAFPFEESLDLGALFFHWELAVAVAGAVIDVNPFDQPDVQSAKDATVATIEAYVRDGAFTAEDASAVSGEQAASALRELLDAHARDGAYVATLAYLPPIFDDVLAELRLAIRAHTRAATTVGYGPRYLHSTGQLHKGGPAHGVFVQLVGRSGAQGVEIPGADYDFGALVTAQAIGDAHALKQRGLPLLRIDVDPDPVTAIRALAAAIAVGG